MSFPTYFISHGGGPWPWMKKEMPFYQKLEHSLREMPQQWPTTPQALLVISGHWEESEFTVMSNSHPPMIYDYHGFPAHTYQIQYRAPGSPAIAQKVFDLLQQANIPVRLDEERGFDHGTYSPLVEIYPQANVPVLQLSMKRGYDPQTHFEMGRALASLRDEGVVIIGSGLSYHNLRHFGPGAKEASKQFDEWLNETMRKKPTQRFEGLMNWEKAPSARAAHPREDHLVPLFVALGAAEKETATLIYHEEDFMGGIAVSSFKFG